MGAFDDIVAQLMGQGGSASPAAAPGDPLVIAPQAAPSPVVAGDPMVITPQVAAAAPAAPRARKSDGFTLPALTMTAPTVSAVPFGHSSGMIAPQAAPAMMGDVLSTPQPQRRQYTPLPVYT